MKYKYQPHVNLSGPGEKITTFPLLKVTFKHRRTEITVDCLVDSGASETLLSDDIAIVLGIDLSSAPVQEYSGIANVSIRGRRHRVKVRVSGFDKWITIDDGFVPQNEMPLLGHSGFFENYGITFRAYQQKFEVKSPRTEVKRPQ